MAKKSRRGGKQTGDGGDRGMEFDAGAVRQLRGAGPKFRHDQHVIYSCDLVDTTQRMVCQATINRIWQKGGEWIYDILFTDSSDGHYGQDNVPEDELRVASARPRAPPDHTMPLH